MASEAETEAQRLGAAIGGRVEAASQLADDVDSWPGLTAEQRAEVVREISLRERAATIAASLGLDPHDVRLILVCLALSPTERLQRGLIDVRRDVAHQR